MSGGGFFGGFGGPVRWTRLRRARLRWRPWRFGGPGGFGGGWGMQGCGLAGLGGPFRADSAGAVAPLKRAAFVTAAMLLDGPADPAQVVQRVADKTGGAITPPQEWRSLPSECSPAAAW